MFLAKFKVFAQCSQPNFNKIIVHTLFLGMLKNDIKKVKKLADMTDYQIYVRLEL
jgi:hypothetical protein